MYSKILFSIITIYTTQQELSCFPDYNLTVQSQPVSSFRYLLTVLVDAAYGECSVATHTFIQRR